MRTQFKVATVYSIHTQSLSDVHYCHNFRPIANTIKILQISDWQGARLLYYTVYVISVHLSFILDGRVGLRGW